MFNKNNYDWTKLNNDIILKIFDYANIDCKVCKRKIKNINIFLLKYNNSNKKFIYCSKECYNFI